MQATTLTWFVMLFALTIALVSATLQDDPVLRGTSEIEEKCQSEGV
jgi:hypothetical protein